MIFFAKKWNNRSWVSVLPKFSKIKTKRFHSFFCLWYGMTWNEAHDKIHHFEMFDKTQSAISCQLSISIAIKSRNYFQDFQFKFFFLAFYRKIKIFSIVCVTFCVNYTFNLSDWSNQRILTRSRAITIFAPKLPTFKMTN